MASTLGYATEVDLENYLLVDIDSSFSSQIDEWISTAEVEVNNYLGYTTASGIWNEQITNEVSDTRIDGHGDLVIHPRKSPVNSVSQIEIVQGTISFDLSLTDGSGTARYNIPTRGRSIVYPNYNLSIVSSNFSIRSFDEIKFKHTFTRIDYIAGYTSVPGPIKTATLLHTSDLFMRQANKEGLTALTQGRITKRWSPTRDGESNWIRQANSRLNHYRLASNWV